MTEPWRLPRRPSDFHQVRNDIRNTPPISPTRRDGRRGWLVLVALLIGAAVVGSQILGGKTAPNDPLSGDWSGRTNETQERIALHLLHDGGRVEGSVEYRDRHCGGRLDYGGTDSSGRITLVQHSPTGPTCADGVRWYLHLATDGQLWSLLQAVAPDGSQIDVNVARET